MRPACIGVTFGRLGWVVDQTRWNERRLFSSVTTVEAFQTTPTDVVHGEPFDRPKWAGRFPD